MTGTQEEWDDYNAEMVRGFARGMARNVSQAALPGADGNATLLEGYVYCPEDYSVVATLYGDYYAEIDEQYQCLWKDQGYMLSFEKDWLEAGGEMPF